MGHFLGHKQTTPPPEHTIPPDPAQPLERAGIAAVGKVLLVAQPPGFRVLPPDLIVTVIAQAQKLLIPPSAKVAPGAGCIAGFKA
jgi:hypothetical protein